ncbi:hypothetical protein WKV53_19880 [Luteolibacter sp. Y139]|uniref:Ig-like domain-containing protein n=1 Tax=Luteolibacter soli TaxID=3135280 RepID=A0ABU9AYE2_9BACT
MKGNCTTLQRYNGTGWDTISKRVSITGPSRSRETVEQELTLDCDASGGSSTKKKSPGTKEIGDISVEVLWNPNTPSGTKQVNTATGAGTVTVAGNASFTVTDPALAGSPKAYAVPVPTGAPAVWMAAARLWFQTNAAAADLRALYDISGATDKLILTASDSRADVPTLNVAIATGSATGITTAATSADTTAGVAGFDNDENHHLFEDDYDAEVATFWRIVHENAAGTGMLVHATVKEIGEPSHEPNKDVKVTFTLEPTGEFFKKANDIESYVLPASITAPQNNWGHN